MKLSAHSLADSNYRYAQYHIGFMYNILLWRDVNKHSRDRGFYSHGAEACHDPHSLWTKVKPYVDVMALYLTKSDCPWNGTLNLTQFISFRFLKYFLYHSYALHRIMEYEEEVDLCAEDFSFH